MDRYDSIIIGAGHNGLICAAYLAQGGQNVQAVRPRTGGKRVVNDQGDVVSMRDLGEASDVHHEVRRLTGRLCPQETCPGRDLVLPLIQVAGV